MHLACDNKVDTTTIVDKISSPVVSPLLSIHPNDVTLYDRELPSQWLSWWAWASDYAQAEPDHAPAWLELMHYYMRPSDDDRPQVDIPPELCSLVDFVRSLQLDRTPSAFKTCRSGDRTYGMSPKKVHEIDRMSAYIHHLVHAESPRTVWHAVDIGSGQGYLSRALQALGFHVLALDNNENQILGASQWTTKEAARKLNRKRHCNSEAPNGVQKGSLTHRTVHVCPRTLEQSITDWLSDPLGSHGHDDHGNRDSPTHSKPIPVLMVALHACGSLTVDVLRTFLSDRARAPQVEGLERAWRPYSLVIVGCCYNLMSLSDFPLSKPLRDLDPIPKLAIAALHLAAQVPSQWTKDEDALRGAKLALRKVVYRALLQPILQAAAAQLNAIAGRATLLGRPIQAGLGETLENRRLGKLNDKAYQDWPTFLERATDKLDIDLATINTPLPHWFTHGATRLKMESALFVLQTLRCILGPLIETLILLDRRDWIKYELAKMSDHHPKVGVEMVNLFDQGTGSGRNVALVIGPTTILQHLSHWD